MSARNRCLMKAVIAADIGAKRLARWGPAAAPIRPSDKCPRNDKHLLAMRDGFPRTDRPGVFAEQSSATATAISRSLISRSLISRSLISRSLTGDRAIRVVSAAILPEAEPSRAGSAHGPRHPLPFPAQHVGRWYTV